MTTSHIQNSCADSCAGLLFFFLDAVRVCADSHIDRRVLNKGNEMGWSAIFIYLYGRFVKINQDETTKLF